MTTGQFSFLHFLSFGPFLQFLAVFAFLGHFCSFWLVSFAVHWVKAEIHEYVLKNWKIVKIATTKAQRKLFFNLRGKKKGLEWFTEEEIEQVAKDLGVKPSEVREMEKRLSGSDMSFDPLSEYDDDEASFAPSQYLEDEEANPADIFEDQSHSEESTSQLYEAINK